VAKPGSEILAGLDGGKVVASVMVGHDSHRRARALAEASWLLPNTGSKHKASESSF